MTSAKVDPSIQKLRDLGVRIKARIREMKENGAFADAADPFLKSAEEKCAEIDRKLDVAVSQGATLDSITFEAERDYEGLSVELSNFIQRIDANAGKASRP